jgi:hypothetical protein
MVKNLLVEIRSEQVRKLLDWESRGRAQYGRLFLSRARSIFATLRDQKTNSIEIRVAFLMTKTATASQGSAEPFRLTTVGILLATIRQKASRFARTLAKRDAKLAHGEGTRWESSPWLKRSRTYNQ